MLQCLGLLDDLWMVMYIGNNGMAMYTDVLKFTPKQGDGSSKQET
jgi:hypothetical protein